MKLSDFDYHLPKNSIAQEPAKPRDYSRLLIMDRNTGSIEHKHFYDIVDYLEKGDVLVMNNSKVFPARLIGKKKETGGRIEVFLLRELIAGSFQKDKCKSNVKCQMSNVGGKPSNEKSAKHSPPPLSRRNGTSSWQCLLGGHGRKKGLEVEFGRGLGCRILKDNGDGTWTAEFNRTAADMMKVVQKIGLVPLPPYIKRVGSKKFPPEADPPSAEKAESRWDKNNYQTIYADDDKTGSVAAPTAGLHFTPALMRKLRKKGVQIEYITLHVGLGTFAPVKVDNIEEHEMHAEWVEAGAETIANIFSAKNECRRIVAVGTTTVRTLEAIVSEFPISKQISNFKFQKQFNDFNEFVDIFIYPGYKFKAIDAMITNFHLPKSTLLMLVSAFAGREKILAAYREAITEGYRFYSYGDAMLII